MHDKKSYKIIDIPGAISAISSIFKNSECCGKEVSQSIYSLATMNVQFFILTLSFVRKSIKIFCSHEEPKFSNIIYTKLIILHFQVFPTKA